MIDDKFIFVTDTKTKPMTVKELLADDTKIPEFKEEIRELRKIVGKTGNLFIQQYGSECYFTVFVQQVGSGKIFTRWISDEVKYDAGKIEIDMFCEAKIVLEAKD